MIHFGTGHLYGVNNAANSTPFKFGKLQDVSIDITQTVKELHGQSKFAVDIRHGQAKLTGKAKMAELNGRMVNDLFFGETLSTGVLMPAVAESGTVTAGAVTVANAATFDTDLGVINAATGQPLTKVAATPAAGQYSVASGVYSFATADNGMSVQIDYLYTAAAGGNQIALGAAAIGATTKFMGVFAGMTDGKGITLKLNACVSSKLTFATKKEDYTIPEFDFEAGLDTAGSLGVLSVSD